MSLSLTSSAVLARRFMYSRTESSRSAEHGPMMSTLRASSPVKTLATSASNACFLAVSSAESGISSRISMGIGSLRLKSMAIGASSIYRESKKRIVECSALSAVAR